MRPAAALVREAVAAAAARVLRAHRVGLDELPSDARAALGRLRLPPESVAASGVDYSSDALFALHRAAAPRAQSLPPPPQLAREIAAALSSDADARAACSAEPAGTAFLNLRLSDGFVGARVRALAADADADAAAPPPPPPRSTRAQFALPPLAGAARRVAIDMSSPNIAKEMHVGHLRSTIIGEALARTLEHCGHAVSRINHVGDWGTQFGMLVAQVRDALGGPRDGVDIAAVDALYKAAKRRFDCEPEFQRRARAEVVAIQSGAPEAVAVWRWLCGVSRAHFDGVYRRLGVSLEERGESFYRDMCGGVVDALLSAGAAQHVDGAVLAHPPPGSAAAPLIVRKGDGGFTYATTDLAALRHRVRAGHDWLVYVVDSGQSAHLAGVFAAARAAGFAGPDVRIDHVDFGVVLGADGKRLRSREGSSVRLAALLDEAEARAREVLETREAAEESAEVGLAAADRDQLARAIGINAVKYADLRSPRRSGYQFSFDKMLALRGNTAVYLLYALARLRALLRRAERPAPAPAEDAALLAGAHPLERALAAQVTRFHDAVEEATGALAPHVLCEFAYALAEAANAFYRQCRVLGDPREGARLLLVRAAARTLSEALTLLGLEPVERL